MGQLNFKLLKRLQLLLLAVMIPHLASANQWGDCDFELDGLYYDIYQSNTVYVTYDREYDEDAEAYLNIPYNLSGELTIPSSITRNGTTYTVVGIDDYSFEGCTGITSINLPNTINRIGKQAFYGCSGITSINIPSSIKYLGTEAFKNCTKLESISFGSTDNLVSIGSYVFYNTKWWNEQPNGLAYLANNTIAYAYKGNASTNERITLDYNTKIIAGTAFANCSNLKYIGVPNSVQRIGQEAFAYCTNLNEIYIGTGIKTIEERAFMNCGTFKMLIRATTKPAFYQSSGDWENVGVFFHSSPTLYVPSELITSYQNEYFGYDDFHPNYTISEIVDVSNIIIQSESTDVLVGEQLSLTATCKPDNASLNGVIWSSENNYIATVDQDGVVTGLREGTVTIGARSTDYNYYKSIDITVSLPTVTIGDYTYKIDEANGIASVKANKEYSLTTNNTITSLSFANTVEYKGVVYPVSKISKSGFSHCIGITELSIPNFITEVENGAFSNCSFTKAMIPASVTHIGQQAFFNCSSLQEVIFEDCDNEILLDNNKYSDGYGGGLFENCPIATAYIGRNIVVSNYNDSYNRPYSNAPFSRWDANAKCPITSVEIGTNVTQFCDYLFEDCKSISSFTSHIANPSIISLGTSVFRDIPTSTCTLYVPYGSADLYRNADQWSAFANIFEMEPTTVPATSIVLNQTEAELTEGESLTLTATVLPENATNKTVMWTSSDENIATVDNGVVTAVYAGTATITAQIAYGSNVSTNCTITVIPSHIEFADAAVKQICLANWDTNNDGFFTEAEAAAVSDIGTVFKNNSTITSFDELQYFTGITSIANSAFSSCTNLASVTIPNSVRRIGSSAFSGCTGLTSINIPNSVTSMENNAFDGCSGLSAVHITDIDAWFRILFDNQSSNPLSYGHHLYLNDTEIKELIIPNTIVYINNYAFSGCSGLTSVTISNSVNYICNNAFSYCSGLTSVTIPNSVTDIYDNAFSYCSGLTSVTIPNSVTYIGSEAFYSTGLTSVTIPNSITRIEYNTFANCNNLTNVTLPNSVTYIGTAAFKDCGSLYSVIIPSSVTTIGMEAFSYTGLTSVTIPNSVTSISDYTFSGCSYLTSLIVPNSVTTIGNGAFGDCSGLTSVVIPSSVTSIGGSAFYNCRNIKDFYCENQNPSNISLGSNIFDYSLPSTCTLHVPYGTVNLYRATYPWSEFINIVAMEPEVYVNSVALNQTEAELTEGETMQLTATVLPEDATDKTVTWASSDENVATVENGVVTAVAEGTATITATTVDGSNLSASCALTVNRLIIPGDANGDNSIDATDYVATANYILGDIPEGFDISAIDFDNNGVIDVADLVGVTNMILNANATQPAPQYAGAIGLKEFDLNNHLYVESIAHSGVNTYTVSIALDNQDAFTALQADIYLPEDVALSSNFILSDRKAKDHSITSQVQPNGAIRIFISSPGCKNLRESSGEIVSFQVQGNIPTALEIKRIIASTDQAVGFHLQDFNLQNVITGIDSLFNSGNGTDDTYYNILGIPVENPTPGIYIKKGQKVIVK